MKYIQSVSVATGTELLASLDRYIAVISTVEFVS